MSIECLQDVQVQVCAADTKQANSLFDIEIWVVPRFIRPLQSYFYISLQGTFFHIFYIYFHETEKEIGDEREIRADQGRGDPPDQ